MLGARRRFEQCSGQFVRAFLKPEKPTHGSVIMGRARESEPLADEHWQPRPFPNFLPIGKFARHRFREAGTPSAGRNEDTGGGRQAAPFSSTPKFPPGHHRPCRCLAPPIVLGASDRSRRGLAVSYPVSSDVDQPDPHGHPPDMPSVPANGLELPVAGPRALASSRCRNVTRWR